MSTHTHMRASAAAEAEGGKSRDALDVLERILLRRIEALRAHAEHDDERPRPTATHWSTRDGELIRPRDMSGQHLVNTIRMLRRQARPFVRLHNELEALTMLRGPRPIGELANDAFENELLDLADEPPTATVDRFLEDQVATWPALLAEARRRGFVITESVELDPDLERALRGAPAER